MPRSIFLKLTEKLPGVKTGVSLKDYTTFKIGGPAEYFLVVNNEAELLGALKVARELGLPVFVLGGGSNLLIPDKGLKGLVVKLGSNGKIGIKGNTITADGGVMMSDLVAFSIKKSLAGLEWAGGLPGTFGGAIRGNAGAFGGEIKDSILNVDVLDTSLRLRKFSNKQCRFSYRSSILKEKNWVAVTATLQFKKGNRKKLQAIADARIAYRKEKHPLEYPSAGSVFKNVPVKSLSLALQKEFADKIKQDPFPIVPAAWFIIGAGLTGRKIGGAQISKKHSNYIVNLGRATATDIVKLITLVKKTVKKKYGVDLEVECMIL